MAKRGKTGLVKKILFVFFWLLIWQIASMAVGSELLLPSPWQTLQAFGGLMMQQSFYFDVGWSMARILGGFIFGAVTGMLLGLIGSRWTWVKDLCGPILALAKSVPVASFIILAVLWMRSALVPVFIGFLIVWPIVQENTTAGIASIPRVLLEMAQVYQFGPLKTFRAITLPHVLPYLHGAAKSAIGLGFKSAVAAEVITRPVYAMGSRLYESKLYLEVPELFAWTMVILLLSVGTEKMYGFWVSHTAWAKRGLLTGGIHERNGSV